MGIGPLLSALQLIICTNSQSETLNLTTNFFRYVQILSFRAYRVESMPILQFALENKLFSTSTLHHSLEDITEGRK